MQRVLTFVHNKKKYVSKPWCFGAATLVEKEYMDVAEGEKVTATWYVQMPLTICLRVQRRHKIF